MKPQARVRKFRLHRGRAHQVRAHQVRLVPPRCWFQDKDGTYFRNIPLIMAEQKAVMYKPWLAGYFRQLTAEWNQAWREGLIRKDSLSPGDVVVEPAPFRVVYPDKPGLWVLDELPEHRP